VLFAAAVMLLGLSSTADAETQEDLQQARQVELDRACEAVRQVALAPRRQEIYEECIDRFGKEEAVRRNEANGYNGNRIGGTPLFYDLKKKGTLCFYLNLTKQNVPISPYGKTRTIFGCVSVFRVIPWRFIRVGV